MAFLSATVDFRTLFQQAHRACGVASLSAALELRKPIHPASQANGLPSFAENVDAWVSRGM